MSRVTRIAPATCASWRATLQNEERATATASKGWPCDSVERDELVVVGSGVAARSSVIEKEDRRSLETATQWPDVIPTTDTLHGCVSRTVKLFKLRFVQSDRIAPSDLRGESARMSTTTAVAVDAALRGTASGSICLRSGRLRGRSPECQAAWPDRRQQSSSRVPRLVIKCLVRLATSARSGNITRGVREQERSGWASR